jgi:hypothetical protein
VSKRGQLKDGQAVFVRLEKGLHSGARVVLGTILNEHNVLTRLAEHLFEVGRIALGGQPLVLTLEEEPAREILNPAKHLIPLSLAGGLDGRLLALSRPGVAQGTPLGEGGSIEPFEKPRSFCPSRCLLIAQNLGMRPTVGENYKNYNALLAHLRLTNAVPQAILNPSAGDWIAYSSYRQREHPY